MQAEQIKRFCKDRGASLVGIGDVASFAGAPAGHSPRDFLPSAESVISLGIKIPGPLLEWSDLVKGSEVLQDREMEAKVGRHIYGRCGYSVINDLLEQMALRLTLRLEDEGCESIYFPATYGAGGSELMKETGYFGPFSHRHAAVRAGLGEFGYNGLVLTPEYGPRVRFISIVTAADLETDPVLVDPVCGRADCLQCITACGGQALVPSSDIDAETIHLNVPSTFDRQKCHQAQGREGCTGRCIAICPRGRG